MRACHYVAGHARVGVHHLVPLTRLASHALALHSGLSRRGTLARRSGLTRRGTLALPGPGLTAALPSTGVAAALTMTGIALAVHSEGCGRKWLTRV
jgi:hypothetical protein